MTDMIDSLHDVRHLEKIAPIRHFPAADTQYLLRYPLYSDNGVQEIHTTYVLRYIHIQVTRLVLINTRQ